MSSESNDSLSSLYDGFLLNVENTVEINLDDIKNISEESKNSNIESFYNCLSNEDLFDLFVSCKIKAFSSKTVETNNLSNSIFGEEYSLKFILNNRTEFMKAKIWSGLLSLYRDLEKVRENRNNRLELIEEKMNELTKELSTKVKNDMFNIDVNNTTNNMIDDIVSSFQNVMNQNANPFDNIMNITNKITEKYHKKIEDGEIEIEKVMGNLQENLPNMGSMMGEEKQEKEKIIIDENFSTADVEVESKEKENANGFNVGNMMKAAQNMPDIGNLSNVMSKLTNIDENTNMDEVKSEMDSFLEKDLGLDMNEFNKNLEDLQKKLESENLKEKLVEE